MEVKINEEQSLALVKQEVENAENVSRLKVTSEAKAVEALEARKTVKVALAMIATQKKSIIDPMNTAVKNVRELFKPWEERIATVDSWLRGELTRWEAKKAEEAQEKQAELEKKVAEGKITIAQASVKAEKAIAKVQAIPTREITKLRIVDASKLPRDFLIPDENKIFDALKSGQKVEGAELYKEKIVVNSR